MGRGRRRPTSWHPGHIAERYGLFTIIVLGETLLAPTVGVQGPCRPTGSADLVVAAAAWLIVFRLWWLYFDIPPNRAGPRLEASAFVWGYGHYFVFASVAAFGAGLEVAAAGTHGGSGDRRGHDGGAGDRGAGRRLSRRDGHPRRVDWTGSRPDGWPS